jgi:hypothetical protein
MHVVGLHPAFGEHKVHHGVFVKQTYWSQNPYTPTLRGCLKNQNARG